MSGIEGTVVVQCCAGEYCKLDGVPIIYKYGCGPLVDNIYRGYHVFFCDKPVHGGPCCDINHIEDTGHFKYLKYCNTDILSASKPSHKPRNSSTSKTSAANEDGTPSLNRKKEAELSEKKKSIIKGLTLQSVLIDDNNIVKVG